MFALVCSRAAAGVRGLVSRVYQPEWVQAISGALELTAAAATATATATAAAAALSVGGVPAQVGAYQHRMSTVGGTWGDHADSALRSCIAKWQG